MANKEIFKKVATASISIIANAYDNTVTPVKNGTQFDFEAFYPERMALKRYWLVMRYLKKEGLLEKVLQLELKRMFHAIDDTPRFRKLLMLIIATLYAIDTPESISIAEQCYEYVEIE